MLTLTRETRIRLEEIIQRIENDQLVSLEERIQLKKYSLHVPFIAGKLVQAQRKRKAK